MNSRNKSWDVCLLTEQRYLNRQPGNVYIENIFADEDLLQHALEKRGLRCIRQAWDNPDINWSDVGLILFRTPWNYFEKFEAFSIWLEQTSNRTTFLNPVSLVRWNLDKSYLWDLAAKGLNIVPGLYISKGHSFPLADWCSTTCWTEFILKPAVSGTARHTYRFKKEQIPDVQLLFDRLLREESMLVQEFQESVVASGEVSLVMLGGKFSHAVLKKAKPGDFRVQDDFGGSLHAYEPMDEEITLAERALAACPSLPLYARVDLVRNHQNEPCIAELELIEPELWFRRCPQAAEKMADMVLEASKNR